MKRKLFILFFALILFGSCLTLCNHSIGNSSLGPTAGTSGHKVPAFSPMETINWKEIEDRLFEAGEEIVTKVTQTYPKEIFYGMVIELGQNWVFELHLNTEAGLTEGVAKFRSGSRGYEEKSDAEIAGVLGRWYFGAWKYPMLSFTVGGKLKELNRENYERLETARDTISPYEEGEPARDAILSGFKNASVEAAKRLKSSPTIQTLSCTPDFTIHIVGDDGLEYFTKKHL